MTTFLPFALPDLGQEEIDEVVDTLRSGWITTGPKSKRFEEDFARYLGNDVECVAVNSATAGLHLALEAIGVAPGDEVITTTHTFTATAEVVRYLGADVVLVDIDPSSYCIDASAVEAAISARSKAIIPVHFAGLPCDLRAISDIARRYGLRVIEDAAHAFPAVDRGRLVGTSDSAATVFSFYANKTIATGEGGMLVTRDAGIARRARTMRLHGIDRDAFDRFTASRPSWFYEVVAPGFKYNLPDVAAAIGLQQLRKIDRFLVRREELARRYDDGLADLPLDLPPRPSAGSRHAWHLYVVKLHDSAGINRDDLISELFSLGIGCSVHYIPLHRQPYWQQRYELTPEQFPVSDSLFQHCVSLPLYTRMTDGDQERVIDALRSVLG